jgi:hypothetical protein
VLVVQRKELGELVADDSCGPVGSRLAGEDADLVFPSLADFSGAEVHRSVGGGLAAARRDPGRRPTPSGSACPAHRCGQRPGAPHITVARWRNASPPTARDTTRSKPSSGPSPETAARRHPIQPAPEPARRAGHRRVRRPRPPETARHKIQKRDPAAAGPQHVGLGRHHVAVTSRDVSASPVWRCSSTPATARACA